MSIPQLIDANLSEIQAEALKNELDSVFQQEGPQNPFIDTNRGSCFNQKAADTINKMVKTAELSWKALPLALIFAHNTSYQSLCHPSKRNSTVTYSSTSTMPPGSIALPRAGMYPLSRTPLTHQILAYGDMPLLATSP